MANSLRDCILAAAGHNGTIACSVDTSGANPILTLTQATSGSVGNKVITSTNFGTHWGGTTCSQDYLGNSSFINGADNGGASTLFGKMTVTLSTTSSANDTINLTQVVLGNAGNSAIQSAGGAGAWGTTTFTGFYGGADNGGADTHYGKITVTVDSPTAFLTNLSLTQVAAGLLGNNTIVLYGAWNVNTVTGFSGGTDGAEDAAADQLVDCAIHTTLRTTVVRANSIIVEDTGTSSVDIFRDGQLTGYIAYIKTGGSAGDTKAFRISHNYGKLIHFTGLSDVLSTYGVATTQDVMIIAPFGVHRIAGWNPGTYTTINKVMRIWITPSTGTTVASDNPTPVGEDYFSVGAIVGGPVVGFDVPLNWTSTEGNASNVETKILPNGMKVRYNLGPPRRTFSGALVGDAEKFYPSTTLTDGGFVEYRRMFRDMISTFSKYQERPMCLILDGDATASGAWSSGVHMGRTAPDTILYCTFEPSLSLADEAWQKTSSINSRVGDMNVKFEEEL